MSTSAAHSSLLPTTTSADHDVSSKKNQHQSSLFSAKHIILLTTILVLAVAAIVVACIVAAAYFPALLSQRTNSNSPQELSLGDKEKLHSMVVDDQVATIARRKGPISNPRTMRASCNTHISNETIPLAHVSGTGIEWRNTEMQRPSDGAGIPLQGYQSSWKCDYNQGGMNFSKDAQQLTFPVCGYYYFSSQVLFQYTSQVPNNENKPVKHGIEIISRCEDYQSPTYMYSFSNLKEEQDLKTSTYLGDIIKICAGGSIRLIIPTHQNLCCARGGVMNTHFSAFLIQETSCSSSN